MVARQRQFPSPHANRGLRDASASARADMHAAGHFGEARDTAIAVAERRPVDLRVRWLKSRNRGRVGWSPFGTIPRRLVPRNDEVTNSLQSRETGTGPRRGATQPPLQLYRYGEREAPRPPALLGDYPRFERARRRGHARRSQPVAIQPALNPSVKPVVNRSVAVTLLSSGPPPVRPKHAGKIRTGSSNECATSQWRPLTRSRTRSIFDQPGPSRQEGRIDDFPLSPSNS